MYSYLSVQFRLAAIDRVDIELAAIDFRVDIEENMGYLLIYASGLGCIHLDLFNFIFLQSILE